MSESYEPSSNELQKREQDDHGLGNALAWFQSIKEMVEAYDLALERPASPDELDEVQQRIQESVLSVEVRSDWHTPGGRHKGHDWKSPTIGNRNPEYAPDAPTEYRILLTTGGPACQLVGEINEHGEPESARLEMQDWFKPWTEVRESALIPAPHSGLELVEACERVKEILLTFARQFYFGEG